MEARTYVEIKRALRRPAGAVADDAIARLRAFGDQLAYGWDHPGQETGA